ncbi:MAG: S8 family peptidase [Candidatus Kapabacteria bacterium]|nr:S8 family peptidase [Ignavibacteriota bacterium]MCW5885636.1 S8 family peptidase [Candidatus Kapabacteria bacterium]
MIRNFFLIFSLLAMTVSLSFASEVSFGIDPKGNRYVKGELIIKLANHVNIDDVDNTSSRQNNPASYLGIPSVDGLLQPAGAIRASKAFSGIKNISSKKLSNPNSPSANNLERYYKIELDESASLGKIMDGLKRDPNIEHVEYSYIYTSTALPDDDMYNSLNYLPQIKAPQAWDIHKGENGPEVVIGIHDSGTQWDHEDLFDNLKINYDEWTNQNEPLFITHGGRLMINPAAVDGQDSDGNGYIDDVVGFNFFTFDGTQDNDPYASSANRHGTHVAGLAAGVTNNMIGTSSVSWNVKFIPTKHSSNIPPSNSLFNVEDGLWYMASRGVDVINMSWGGSSFSFMMYDLFQYLNDMGIILIASAGNNNNDGINFPSSYPGVISVSAVKDDDTKASYSSYGIQADISAPGGDSGQLLMSTVPTNSYAGLGGTSMASPVVAGTAALIKSYKPNWTSEQIKRQLIGTADDINTLNPQFNGQLGSGRVNAFRALTETNVSVSDQPRIGAVDYYVYNQSQSQTMNPGDDVNIAMLLCNFNKFYPTNTLEFILSFDNDDVEVTNTVSYNSISADDIIELDFSGAKIKSDAKPAIVKGTITVKKLDGTIVSTITVEFNIAGGIFVFELQPNSQHQSGTFIASELTGKGFDVIYSNQLPKSYHGFKAVFISIGSYIENSFQGTNEIFNAVAGYVMGGGRLFLESSSLFSTQVSTILPPTDMGAIFGITGAQSTPNSFIPFNNVVGGTGSIAEGMNFTGTNQPFGFMIEKYTSATMFGARPMLNETGYGTVGNQYPGIFGQRVILMSFALSGYKPNGCPSTREVLLDRIVDFFGLTRPIQVHLPESFSICSGESIQLNALEVLDCSSNTYVNQVATGGSGNYSYSWSNANMLDDANAENPTTYNLQQNASFKLTVTDNVLGTSGEGTTAVNVMQSPNVGVRSLVRVRFNTYVNLNSYITNYSAANTYNWYQGNELIPIDSETAENLKVKLGLNNYFVSAVNEYGCESSVMQKLIINGSFRKEHQEAISGLNGLSNMYTYPSVVSDVLNVSAEFASESNYSIKIKDLLGNNALEVQNGTGLTYDGTLNLNQLPSGAYFLIIETDSDRLVKKFIKM